MEKAIEYVNKEITGVLDFLNNLKTKEAVELYIKSTMLQAYLQGWYDCNKETKQI